MFFTIFGKPFGKQRPRVRIASNFAQIYTPKKTVEYENFIKLSFLEAAKLDQNLFDRKGPLKINILAYYPIPKNMPKKVQQKALAKEICPMKKPDLDNCIKTICDALNKIAYDDDTQIVQIAAQKFYDLNPRVEIEILDYYD